MKWYGNTFYQSIVVSAAIIITGFIGSKLLFFFENGQWDGLSFFGAVYLAPFVFVYVAKWLHLDYLHSLDFCATAGCFILAFLKVQCMVDGCCGGVNLYMNADRVYVRFPSQIVEFASALVLAFVMMFLSQKEKYRRKIYPTTLVTYGFLRFVLNLFRDDWARAKNMGLPVPIGCIWAILSVVIGITWLVIAKRKSKLKVEQ